MFNAHSIANKSCNAFNEIYSMCSPDVIFITESWLHNSDRILLPDICKSFNIVGSDCLAQSGGVDVCINNTIPYNLTSTCSYTDGSFEFLSLDMFPNSSYCIRFILVYRTMHCKSNVLSSLIDYLFCSIPSNPDAKYVILGSFNFSSLFTDTSPTIINYITSDSATQSFADFCYQFSLTQHALSLITGNNIINVILAPANSNFLSNFNINMPVCQSDHSLISFNIN